LKHLDGHDIGDKNHYVQIGVQRLKEGKNARVPHARRLVHGDASLGGRNAHRAGPRRGIRRAEDRGDVHPTFEQRQQYLLAEGGLPGQNDAETHQPPNFLRVPPIRASVTTIALARGVLLLAFAPQA
jgi:hypothetical protein